MQNIEKVMLMNKDEIARNIAEEYCIDPQTYKISPLLTETTCKNCRFNGENGNCRQNILNWLRSEVGQNKTEGEHTWDQNLWADNELMRNTPAEFVQKV